MREFSVHHTSWYRNAKQKNYGRFLLEPCLQSEQKFSLNKQYCSLYSVNVNLNFIDFSSFVFNINLFWFYNFVSAFSINSLYLCSFMSMLFKY